MFSYEKMLQYPVNIKNPNPKYAQIVLEQYGGPDGERCFASLPLSAFFDAVSGA